jgi:thymidylate synthase
MWGKLLQNDGRIFSNYGHFWFTQGGFDWVVKTLSKDVDSRQAYIPMCNASHMFEGNKDVVCTKGIQFRMRHGFLNMHVSMRSSDAIYGLATDLPCFWTLWQMVACQMGVRIGEFIFSADSVHIYEKHYEMAEQMICEGELVHIHPEPPAVTSASDLINQQYMTPFGRWLTEVWL